METLIRNKKPEVCNKCGRSGEAVKFYTRKNQIGERYYNLTCSSCKNSDQRQRKKAYRAKLKQTDPDSYYLEARDWQLRIKYKINLEEYKAIFEKQNYGCAICGVDDRKDPRWFDMPVDHCHRTGKNRAILCHSCNHMLGKAKDNPDTLRKAALYLEKYV